MASAVNSKTREIAELMQRLKAGEISKAELFMQLSKLQPTGSGEVAEVRIKRNGASFAASVVDNRDRGDVSSVRSQQQSLYDTDRAGVSHDQAKLMSVQQLLASRLAAEKALQRSHPSTTRVDETREADVATAKFIPTDPFAYSPMEESPSFEDSSVTDRSSQPNDDDGGATSRYVHYMDEDSFHVRVSRWKQQKENLKEKLKQEQLEVELTECTFQPTINPKSQKVASKLRHRNAEPVTDRLYKARPSRWHRVFMHGLGCLPQDVINWKLRDEMAQRAREQEEQDEQRECTFKPHVNRTSMMPTVRSKYKEPVYNKKFVAPSAPTTADLDECTFNPKINAIPKDMVSAHLYTQQNIFDRLSRPATAIETPETCLELVDVAKMAHDRPGPRSLDDGKTENEGSRPTSAGSVGDRSDRKRRFNEFMRRQVAQERERQRRLDAARTHHTFEFKPAINKKSNDIMQQGRKGDFIERVAKYALRKEHDKLKNRSIKLQDPQCTFKPKINDVSASRAARSVTELSRGDLLRRETSQRLMKLRMEQHEMSQLTFKPAVNPSTIPHVESKLKVLSSPETYVQRLQEHTLKLYEKQRKALQEQEVQEFSECTFKPHTIDVPTYISRIAKSMELTKALKAKHAHGQRRAKPEWK
ncbi:hypothetical protein H310_03743 [Aphanomyces invadans]|uniref:Uncharacterized protein n=1 Tax=Aphanomyces invadans TaxID=157072 RepID=A0A024UI89_9STRA|nr:hypothetical protein H310_03743 [Aphanomyces invadans]ETW06161.1 hypothetical protein H310_03743 [Aphanomyces invadans]|eukprot:XP_008865938.1 hypothetical protein H310_03743 [Aphanomyces invadans]